MSETYKRVASKEQDQEVIGYLPDWIDEDKIMQLLNESSDNEGICSKSQQVCADIHFLAAFIALGYNWHLLESDFILKWNIEDHLHFYRMINHFSNCYDVLNSKVEEA